MTLAGFDTPRTAERRRPYDKLERRLVRASLNAPQDPDTQRRIEGLRYALSYARLTIVANPDGTEVDLAGMQAAHAQAIHDLVAPFLLDEVDLAGALGTADEAIARTLRTRDSVLTRLSIDRDALEAEVSERQLVIASGGGGGAGYVYPGAYDMIDRIGVEPALMVGTSIGALMSAFRAKRRRLDLATLLSAARALSWSKVFRVLEVESRYGLPATLRLYLRHALGDLFLVDDRPMRLSDMDIPMFSVVTGITVDALKHDMAYYETLIEQDLRTSRTMRARAGLRAMGIVREFLSVPEALQEIVVGREPGTEHFDTLDAAGFSSAIPAVIHYDVLREDPRMHQILDALYAARGITRLGEGGMVSNVPARVAWETAVSGWLGPRRNVFVLGLDCFAPAPSRIAWYPFQQLVRQSNVLADRKFTDLYLPFPKTLSPLNLVPPVEDAMRAIRWGRAAIEPYMPFVTEMMRPIRTLQADASPAASRAG